MCKLIASCVNLTYCFEQLWMGTHPKGPSAICLSGELLSDWIKTHAESVGRKANELTSDAVGHLPFLFKVLSVNKSLSIQMHPNKVKGVITEILSQMISARSRCRFCIEVLIVLLRSSWCYCVSELNSWKLKCACSGDSVRTLILYLFEWPVVIYIRGNTLL